jgi:hypothetical protein
MSGRQRHAVYVEGVQPWLRPSIAAEAAKTAKKLVGYGLKAVPI